MPKQLDILFINHGSQKTIYQDLSHKFTAIEPPTWSLLLAQSCRAKGFSVAILDCDAERLTYQEAVERIKYINPRLACFVTYGQNPNSGTTNMEGATNVARMLKDESDMRVMFIGSHTSALPHEVLAYDFVDFIAINEGVYTLHELLKFDLDEMVFSDADSVPGLGYKGGGKAFLNGGRIVPQERMDIDLPGYAWDLLPYKNKPLDLYRAHFWHAEFDHAKQTPFASLYTSLGCRFKCSFCMINILNRKSTEPGAVSSDTNVMRFWSPELMVKEFDTLTSMGVTSIRLSDEMFFLDKRYFEPLLTQLAAKDYAKDIRMWAYSRVDTVREKYLELFRSAGVKWLALGIEAANQNIRREASKGSFEDVDIRDIVKLTRDSGINVISNYIYGFPHDTEETMKQTEDLALELNTEMMNAYPCMALPGSPLYWEALGKGMPLPTKFSEWSFLSYDSRPMATDFVSAADVIRQRDGAWERYFNRPEYLDLVEKRFGMVARNNIQEMAKIKLKRKLLGDTLTS